MTDKKMIESLRNYARAYVGDKKYDLNPGLALMIANRMEQLIQTDHNYCSELSKETLTYNIQYHLLTHCNTTEECVDKIKILLENFEVKNRYDRKDE